MRFLGKIMLFGLLIVLLCTWAGWSWLHHLGHFAVRVSDGGTEISDIGSAGLLIGLCAAGLAAFVGLLVASVVIPLVLLVVGASVAVGLGAGGLALLGVAGLALWPVLLIVVPLWWLVRRNRHRSAGSAARPE